MPRQPVMAGLLTRLLTMLPNLKRADTEGILRAYEGSLAEGKMDLVTVVSHELGHLLGHEHDSSEGAIMSETLDAGTRIEDDHSEAEVVTETGYGLRAWCSGFQRGGIVISLIGRVATSPCCHLGWISGSMMSAKTAGLERQGSCSQ